MRENIQIEPKDSSALEHSDFAGSQWWEWPAVFILIGLSALWLWRTHLKNKKQRILSRELVRKSRNSHNTT